MPNVPLRIKIQRSLYVDAVR